MKNVFLLSFFIFTFSLSAQDYNDYADYGVGGNEPKKPSKITWDLGFSTGSNGGVGYSEANLGINYFLKEWLVWRNSGFARFPSDDTLDDIYGLDTSARAYSVTKFSERSHLTMFIGPGYRFASEGSSLAFAEAGINLTAVGLNVGVGAKTFFENPGDDNSKPDTQYFLILAGSGSI